MPEYNINDLAWKTELTGHGCFLKTALLEEWQDAPEDSPVACIMYNPSTGDAEFSIYNYSEERNEVTSANDDGKAILDEKFGAQQWRTTSANLASEYNSAVEEALRLVKSAGYTVS